MFITNNPDANNAVKALSILLIISVIIFLIGSAIAIYFIFVSPVNKGKTKAIITDITNNSTKVSYVVNGKKYNKTYTAYSSTYYVGKTIKIYYNKINPYKSFIANMRYLSLIGPGIGIIMLGVSGIGCMITYSKYYKV